MKTKEKAKELVEKYRAEMPDIYFEYMNYVAIECAKIAVDEIVKQWDYIDTYLADMGGELNPNLKYWYEVKNELDKML